MVSLYEASTADLTLVTPHRKLDYWVQAESEWSARVHMLKKKKGFNDDNGLFSNLILSDVWVAV
jgi:hypothetical protein